MGIDKFMGATVLFLLLVVTGFGILTDVGNRYTDINFENDSFLPLYDTVNNITGEFDDTTQGMKSKAFGEDSTPEDENIENSLFRGAFGAIGLIPSVFGFAGSLISVIASSIGIPSIFVTFAIIGITLFISFAVVLLLLRIRG